MVVMNDIGASQDSEPLPGRRRRGDQPWEELDPSGYFRWKRALDVALAGAMGAASFPVILLLMLVVRLTSPGPAIYRQQRLGKGKKPFMMLKIRTMRQDAELATGAVWTAVNDRRITPVGKVLRKLHLDEFPQLWNVLRGDMSLVGPRPERPEFVHVLAEAVPDYEKRLAARPGITGLAQINLPPDTDLQSVQRKVALDIEYIRRASFLFDARMLLCTMIRLTGLPGVYAMKLFGLQRDVPADELPPIDLPEEFPRPFGVAIRGLEPDESSEAPATVGANGKSNGHAADAGHGNGRTKEHPNGNGANGHEDDKDRELVEEGALRDETL